MPESRCWRAPPPRPPTRRCGSPTTPPTSSRTSTRPTSGSRTWWRSPTTRPSSGRREPSGRSRRCRSSRPTVRSGTTGGSSRDSCAGSTWTAAPGDTRLYDWGANGYGTVQPILYTARNGSTISGHVWATEAGPAKRPGIVITNGSVQAPEELYWFAAQTLAKAGYVVMTWDPQGQGYSDTFGEGVDQQDGFPSQTGQPFYDGTEDALDFFFSTPRTLRTARASRAAAEPTTRPSRPLAWRTAATPRSTPSSRLLDPSRVGVVGQSLGAGAVSYIGQIDPRVKAIVAMDNLSAPTSGPPVRRRRRPGRRTRSSPSPRSG